jgi:branched-chain amino acid transport system permease protein
MDLRTNKKKDGLYTAVALIALIVVLLVMELTMKSTSIFFTVLKKGAIYALVAVSMILLNCFTGLFSRVHAGCMLIGAYTYAILTMPVAVKLSDSVYKYYDCAIGFELGILPSLILAGLIAAFFAALIGLPVLRLKSDYLAIATLGFAEILRAFFQWNALGPLTNGSNLLKNYPDLGGAAAYVILAGALIAVIVLLVNSTYGRAFKAIRDDEIAAEAMGINLARHKQMAFIISSFFAAVGGGMLAMYMGTVQALSFKSTMTYEILLIVVIGGIGSISGSVITSFFYIAAIEWLLRGLDSGTFLGITAPGIFRNGFRLVTFSVIIMIVVLFFRKGIMGDKELPDVIAAWKVKRKQKAAAAVPAEQQDETPKGGA